MEKKIKTEFKMSLSKRKIQNIFKTMINIWEEIAKIPDECYELYCFDETDDGFSLWSLDRNRLGLYVKISIIQKYPKYNKFIIDYCPYDYEEKIRVCKGNCPFFKSDSGCLFIEYVTVWGKTPSQKKALQILNLIKKREKVI